MPRPECIRGITGRARRWSCWSAGEPAPAGRGAWLRIGHEMPADPAPTPRCSMTRCTAWMPQGLDWIAVERPPATPEWAGVLDRLTRAATR